MRLRPVAAALLLALRCSVGAEADLRHFAAWLQGLDLDTAASVLHAVLPGGEQQVAVLEAARRSVAGGAATVRHRGWRSDGGELHAWMHVAHFDASGALAGTHQTARRLLLEIGANSRDTLDMLVRRRSDTFVVSFEPLLDKYGTLLSRNSNPDLRSHLGYHVRDGGIVLPFAVAIDEASTGQGLAQLKISGEVDGCASLLEPVHNYFVKQCANTSGVLEARTVPAVHLNVVLGQWLGGQPVAFAKVDAQGLDLPLMRSASPTLLANVQAVQLEVVRDERVPGRPCKPQYRSTGADRLEAQCTHTEEAMRSLGFVPWGTNCSVMRYPAANGCEADMTFVRPGQFDQDLVRHLCVKMTSCGPNTWNTATRNRVGAANVVHWRP
jgi:hypothetical protein